MIAQGYDRVASGAAGERSDALSLLRALNNAAKSIAIERAAKMMPPGVRVLELACGAGGDVWKWAHAVKGVRWRGIDVSPASAELCNNRLAGRNIDAVAVAGDVLQATWPLTTCEAISMQMAFHYFGARETMHQLLQRVADTLVRGGVFVCSYFDMQSSPFAETRNSTTLCAGQVVIQMRDHGRYSFAMDGHVPDVGEYLVNWDHLLDAAHAAGLEVTYTQSLGEILEAGVDARLHAIIQRAHIETKAFGDHVVRDCVKLHNCYRAIWFVKE